MSLDSNFDAMDIKELRALRSRVDAAIGGFKERKRADAIQAAELAARNHGYKLSDLIGSARKKAARDEVLYAHPNDASLTWSGRGRRPRWVMELLETGRTLEDLLT